MPIKTLRKDKLPFPEIGKIRKGEPKEENKIGKDLDYFRVEIDLRETKALRDFERAYPDEKPREINIRFPFNEIDKNWYYYLEGYTAGAMYAQSDGEIYLYLKDGETGDILVKDGIDLETGKPRPYNPNEPATHYINSKGERKPLHCDPTGKLRVMVVELRRAAYLTVITHAWNDIELIKSQLEGLYELSGGNIQGLPIVLKRRPHMISTPGTDGKRVRREKWLIELEVDPDWAEARFKELERQVYPELGAGEDEEDEEDVIEGEMKEIAPISSGPVVEGEVIRWNAHQLGLVVTKKLAKDLEHAKAGLDRSVLPMDVSDDLLIRWMRKYQAHVDEGEKPEIAAARANAAYEKVVKEKK